MVRAATWRGPASRSPVLSLFTLEDEARVVVVGTGERDGAAAASVASASVCACAITAARLICGAASGGTIVFPNVAALVVVVVVVESRSGGMSVSHPRRYLSLAHYVAAAGVAVTAVHLEVSGFGFGLM